jgi:hypothetical protein
MLCVLNKNRTMDNIQKHNNRINIPSSQTFRSYLNEVITTLNIAYLLHWNIIVFNIIPEHIVAFVPSWQFKNSVEVEIGLLHSRPFTDGHFDFIIVESATCQVLPSVVCYLYPYI